MTDSRGADLAGAGLLRVDTAVVGPAVCVSLIGELDLSTVSSLEARVRRALERHRPSQLILDLRGLTFVESSGLRLLLVLDAEARSERWRLTIVSGPEQVQRTMELVGVKEQLEMVSDRAAAVDGGPAAA